MIKTIVEIFSLLNKDQKRIIFFLQLLVQLVALLEIVNLFTIIPFITLLSDFEVLNKDGYISYIYNFLNFKTPENFLIFAGLLFLFTIFIANLFQIFATWMITRYSMKIGTTLSSRLYSFYLNQPWLFHANNNSAKLINKISQELERVTIGIIQPALLIIARLVLSAFLLTGMFIYNPKIALILVFVIFFSYLIIYSYIKKRISKNGEIISSTQEIRHKLMTEGFGGIREVLISNKQNFFTKQFTKASNDWAESVGKNQAFSLIPRYIVELIAFSLIIFSIIYIVIFETDGNFIQILPTLSIYALCAVKLLPAFQVIFLYYTIIRSNLNAFHNIRQNLIDCSKNDKIILENQINIDLKIELDSELIFSNVNFKYLNRENKNIIDDLSLSINSKQMIGIVGKSGSGKSTIIDLITGIIIPDSGCVFVDGIKLTKNNIKIWQKNISLVSQSIFISDNSIEENIAFGVAPDKIDHERIKTVLEKSQLIDFVNQLPNRTKTVLGEKGVQISGGQRQRIGIARSLYNKSKLLIFDEATSSLDGITEENIINSINNIKNQNTIVIVAHRLLSVRNCDKIFFMDSGKLIDTGNYEDLINRNYLFRKMAGVNKN
jgi:HlyD family secretion protein